MGNSAGNGTPESNTLPESLLDKHNVETWQAPAYKCYWMIHKA